MSVIVAIIFVTAVAFAFLSNQDLFSPAKFFLLSFLAFHVGALLDDTSLELWLLMAVVLAVGSMAVLLEAIQSFARPAARHVGHALSKPSDIRLFVWIWVFSLPALLSQLYLIAYFDGIEGYINAIGFRVIEWRGLGWARTLISTLTLFNVLYFAIGLTRERGRLWWCIYAIHFLILIVVGLLSGSRSGVLNVVALQAFTFHYLKSPIKLRHAVSLAAVLVFFAVLLGIARDGLKLDDSEFTTGFEQADRSAKLASLYYGIEPLQILLDAGPLNLAYGGTFVSLLTNAVPRDWWPDKPDTGGVFFTKTYTNDAWDGASNLTPTFMGEWIINFGWIAGILLFVVSYSALMAFVSERYRKIRERLRDPPDAELAIDFLMYLFLMWAVVALMVGEVTSVILGLLLNQLIPLAFARWFLLRRKRRQPDSRRANGPRSHAAAKEPAL